MLALRRILLAMVAVAAVSSTAAPALAQQPLSCNVQGVEPVIRVQGLTEYVGDIVITCSGGTPTAAGVKVPMDDFEVDIPSTNITSRLLGAHKTSAADGAKPYTESLLVVDEAFPFGGYQNPNQATPFTPLSVTQHACPSSDSPGSCVNYGNGQGGFGDGTDAMSSYGSGNTSGPSGSRPYNVFQGYLVGNHTIRFDGIPVDPPGPGGVTSDGAPTRYITMRITNIRIDATPFLSSTTPANFGPPISGSVSITGAQAVVLVSPAALPAAHAARPEEVASGGGFTIAYPRYSLTQVPVAETSASQTSKACREPAESNPYHQTTFSYYAKENFADAFKTQTWHYENAYGKTDPLLTTGSGSGHNSSTQDVPVYPYLTESGIFPPGGSDLAGLVDSHAVGAATNGTRLVFTIDGLIRGETITAPSAVGIYGGLNPTGQSTIDSSTVFPAIGPGGTAVAGVLVSGAAILLGAVKPFGSVPTDYSDSFYGFTATDVSVQATGKPIQFVYEVTYADMAFIETMWVPFNVNWCGVKERRPRPQVVTVSVGLGPISPAGNNVASDAHPGNGNDTFPRFATGAGNPFPAQPVWVLKP